MKKSYLFPNYFKKIGLAVLIPAITYYFLAIFFDSLIFEIKMFSIFPSVGMFGDSNGWFSIIKSTFLVSIIFPLITIGMVFIGFSKEKIEDEYITKIREQSFVWSFLIYTAFSILVHLTLYGNIYFYIKIIDRYLFLILFICGFNYKLYKLKKSLKDEE